MNVSSQAAAPGARTIGYVKRERLRVTAEAATSAAPDIVWGLVGDVRRYSEWGPWVATGYRQPGDTDERGPGAIQWLRSERRVYGRHITTVERILAAEPPRRL